MTRASARVLSRELLLRLMPPVLVLVALTAALGAYSAKQLADHVFDRWLFDASRSLAGQVHFDADGRPSLRLPAEAQAMLLFDDVDRTWFSVQADGRLLAGQPGLPTSGDDEVVRSPHGRAFGATVDGRPVRVAREDLLGPQGARVTVLVAETLGKRERASAWLRDMLWPMAALVLATGLAIVLAVRATVRPLEQIAARWRQQSSVSLDAIEAGDVPRELVPFATALNGLLGRLRGLLERERQFSSVAAHQLRTPLAGLQLGLARAREAGDLETVRAVLGELEQTTQRTARVVQQLLALGRLTPESDGVQPGPPVDLVALAQEVGAAQADAALARGLDLELDAPDTPVSVPGQADLLAEALANLLDNAIRYTPAGGRIVVRVQDAPPALGVDDSGPGIPEDEREAVQQRFVRGRGAAGDGSGLGLAIVRDVAALHGARLELGDGAWGGLRAELRFDARRPVP
ncbi:sensor histidine kinase [Rubrivivax gelatinosus]|uniref:histidine kinase n=1 Tax=Rubrivivax gelatinosus (strain NBRC 100245 / IL144) TaxID=983917 RepID=I0HPY4_RUBGI|nr:sensor histidine kinase [Rubrivivax gelatinosus]BAL95071.1 sensor protein [Rubrivivax gelatinosus IL144]